MHFQIPLHDIYTHIYVSKAEICESAVPEPVCCLVLLGEGGNKASRIHDFSPFVRKKKKQSELETKNQRNIII